MFFIRTKHYLLVDQTLLFDWSPRWKKWGTLPEEKLVERRNDVKLFIKQVDEIFLKTITKWTDYYYIDKYIVPYIELSQARIPNFPDLLVARLSEVPSNTSLQSSCQLQYQPQQYWSGVNNIPVFPSTPILVYQHSAGQPRADLIRVDSPPRVRKWILRCLERAVATFLGCQGGILTRNRRGKLKKVWEELQKKSFLLSPFAEVGYNCWRCRVVTFYEGTTTNEKTWYAISYYCGRRHVQMESLIALRL